MQPISREWLSRKVKLSIVIITYNYADVLRRAIDSVSGQLGRDCEMIIIDDGSTDQTAKLLAELELPERVSAGYIVQVNAGPAAARNHALKYANGEWILFLDADDALFDGAINQITTALKEQPDSDLILGGHTAVYPDGREKYHRPSRVPEDLELRVVDYLLNKRINISHGCAVFRTAAVRANPYPEHLRQAEDIAVFAHMLLQPKVVVLDAPLARIYKHPDSLRNDVSLTIANSSQVADSVFRDMPEFIQAYRKQYEARRALSAFRSCYRASRRKEALAYYNSALRLSPRQALRWDYLSKWLRLRFTFVSRRTGLQ